MYDRMQFALIESRITVIFHLHIKSRIALERDDCMHDMVTQRHLWSFRVINRVVASIEKSKMKLFWLFCWFESFLIRLCVVDENKTSLLRRTERINFNRLQSYLDCECEYIAYLPLPFYAIATQFYHFPLSILQQYYLKSFESENLTNFVVSHKLRCSKFISSFHVIKSVAVSRFVFAGIQFNWRNYKNWRKMKKLCISRH